MKYNKANSHGFTQSLHSLYNNCIKCVEQLKVDPKGERNQYSFNSLISMNPVIRQDDMNTQEPLLLDGISSEADLSVMAIYIWVIPSFLRLLPEIG